LLGSEQAHKVRAVKGAHEQREWELQSPYLRHNKNLKNSPCADFFDFIGEDRGMCASGNATQHTIRRRTIRKIIKIYENKFFNFDYCSPRTGTYLRHNKNLKNSPCADFLVD